MSRNQDRQGGHGAPFSLLPHEAPSWDVGRLTLTPAGRPLIMGILNLTPDSFYVDSRRQEIEPALAAARRLISEGADILDLGAESSRPGAEPISDSEEQDRLLPVLEALRRESDIPVTVDTVRTATARAALAAGADAINDISGGLADPQMISLAVEARCGLILMHMRGTPRTMQAGPRYTDAVAEITGWLAARCRVAADAGVAAQRLMVDPGIGFGKELDHNLELLRGLRRVAAGRPLLLGASRKSFIGQVAGVDIEDRLPGSLAALVAAWHGGTAMVRVHDVAPTLQFLQMMQALAGD